MFPEKNFLGFEKGWKNLGKIKNHYSIENGGVYCNVHSFCKTRINIGKENNELFYFCPKCLVKIED